MKLRYRILSAVLVLAGGGCFFMLDLINRKAHKLFPLVVVACSRKSMIWLLAGTCCWIGFCLLFFTRYRSIDPFQFSVPTGWYIVIAGLLAVVYFVIPIVRYHYSGSLYAYVSDFMEQPISYHSVSISNDNSDAVKLNGDQADELNSLLASSQITACIPDSLIDAMEKPEYAWEQSSSIRIYFPSKDPYSLDDVVISFYNDALLAVELHSSSAAPKVPLLFYITNTELQNFIAVCQ